MHRRSRRRRIVQAASSLSAIFAAATLAHAASVTVQSFDDGWTPDSVYGSWPTATFTSTPTSFGVSSKGFGGGYANIGDPFLIDGTGTNTLQLTATVNAGVAGFIVALGDTTGHEWNYAWYGNVPGGGTNGSNTYVFTKPISDKTFSTGAAGNLDITSIDYIHIQVDPGFNPNTVYDVTYDDLSLIGGAASLTWNNTGGTGDGTTWDLTSQNFNNGTGPATFANGDNVTFNATNNGHSAVTISSTVMPGSTTVAGGTYIFSGTGGIGGTGGLAVSGGSLTLNTTANSYTGPTNIASGASLTVNGSLPTTALTADGNASFGASTGSGIFARTLGSITIGANGKVALAAPASSASRTVLVTSGLSFAGGTTVQGLLDLNANDMIIKGGNATTVRQLLQTGLGGTAGISTSATSTGGKKALGYAAITAAGTFDDQSVAAGDVVVKYTLVGDTNLDGSVTFDDLLALAKNYNGTNTTWATGDFTYEGSTGFDDLLGLAKNYNASLGAAEAAAVGQSFAGDYALAVSLVPEPAMLSALALGLVPLRRRRRH